MVVLNVAGVLRLYSYFFETRKHLLPAIYHFILFNYFVTYSGLDSGCCDGVRGTAGDLFYKNKKKMLFKSVFILNAFEYSTLILTIHQAFFVLLLILMILVVVVEQVPVKSQA